MPKPNQTAVYSEIFKMDEQPDGTLIVHGKATDDTLDSDAQICDPEWLKSAMPEWFKYGNIREQHSSIAAGVAVEHEVKGSEHFITAHVVDPGSVSKVKAGVLKGFSIGIRGARVAKDNKAAGGRIVDGTIVEISLVDRPANPACTLTMAKTVKGELTQVEELAEIGSVEMSEVTPEVVETETAEVETVEVADKAITAVELVELSKSFAGDVTKFDKGEFDNARRALATLIQVEAGEMADGSDEVYSLHCLLGAVHALFEWYEGEEAEGETESGTEVEEAEATEMAIAPEEVKEDAPEESDDVEMCKECHKAEAECECPECEDCGKTMKECKCAEGGYSAEMKSLTVSDMRYLIADVVKTLLPTTVEQDITKATETERIETLESELARVKSLAAPSGPKRMGAVSSNKEVSNITKAAEFRKRANATDDLTLRKGFLAIAQDLEKSESN